MYILQQKTGVMCIRAWKRQPKLASNLRLCTPFRESTLNTVVVTCGMGQVFNYAVVATVNVDTKDAKRNVPNGNQQENACCTQYTQWNHSCFLGIFTLHTTEQFLCTLKYTALQKQCRPCPWEWNAKCQQGNNVPNTFNLGIVSLFAMMALAIHKLFGWLRCITKKRAQKAEVKVNFTV